MKKILHKMVCLLIPIFLGVLILIWQIDFIIKLWIGESISIPKYLPECMGLYVFLNCWNNTWSVFVNGIGKVNIQLCSNVISAIIVLVSSWYLMKYMQSASGMALAIATGWLFSGTSLAIQVRYIFKNKH